MQRRPHRNPRRSTSRYMFPLFCVLMLSATAALFFGTRTRAAPADVPEWLSQTGLYADIETQQIAADHLPYTPQYPLWSDGAAKRRWIHLPAGSRIDASDPQHWEFPIGTQLFKEFSFGERIETRLLQRNADGSWTFATYLWQADGKDAQRASDKGHPHYRDIQPGIAWDIPGHYDCLACHESPTHPVLGFNALQLSTDRDPLAPHAESTAGITLEDLQRDGRLQHVDAQHFDTAPRLSGAMPEERALRGYVRANCGNCHNPQSSLEDLGVFLDDASVQMLRDPRLRQRLSTRDPNVQMPPLGTRLVDEQALALLDRWLAAQAVTTPSR